MNIFLTLVFAIFLACSFAGCSGSTGDSDSGSASLAPSDLTSKVAGDVELPR